MGVLPINISRILKIELWNSCNITSVCLSTIMAGNRALHWPHKLYQPSHIAMDTKKFFNVAKIKWMDSKIYLHDLINVERHLFVSKHVLFYNRWKWQMRKVLYFKYWGTIFLLSISFQIYYLNKTTKSKIFSRIKTSSYITFLSINDNLNRNSHFTLISRVE